MSAPSVEPGDAVHFDRTRPPVQWIESGATVSLRVEGRAYRKLASGAPLESIQWASFNTLTGPVGVRNAPPGGVLEVRILRIEIEEAWAVWLPGLGPLGNDTKRTRIRSLEIRKETLVFNESLSIPLRPSIGCLGVAPTGKAVSSLGPCGPWGGNWDAPWDAPGATVHLPVQVAGARFSLGDLHAAAGGGEPASAGIESAGTAILRLAARARERGEVLPRVETPTGVYVAGFSTSLAEARQSAVRRGHRYLRRSRGRSSFEAYTAIAGMARLHFGGPASPMVWLELPVIGE